ncbi:MAG: NAD(P)-dependent alcohol dehydrogenase [Saprospiraceae bacterium]
MKTATIHAGGLAAMRLEQRPVNDPAPREIQVRWRATSLNYHDYLVATGGIPVADGRIPMSDGAGEVVAVGADVHEWKVGDAVMSLFFPNWLEGRATFMKMMAISGETIDGYATEVSNILATAVTAIPNGYSLAEAATLPCAALTAWRALVVEGRIQPGDTVLIQGTGGMSIFALQIALSAGASVFATTSSDEKAERLYDLGVAKVFNYRQDAQWGKTIYKQTGGIQHILDVGGGTTMVQSIEAAAIGGHIASIGILGNGRKGEITFPKLFFKQLRLTGLAVGSRDMQEDMIRSINASGWKPVMDRSFTLDTLADAFHYQATGQHFGKITAVW